MGHNGLTHFNLLMLGYNKRSYILKSHFLKKPDRARKLYHQILLIFGYIAQMDEKRLLPKFI